LSNIEFIDPAQAQTGVVLRKDA